MQSIRTPWRRSQEREAINLVHVADDHEAIRPSTFKIFNKEASLRPSKVRDVHAPRAHHGHLSRRAAPRDDRRTSSRSEEALEFSSS